MAQNLGTRLRHAWNAFLNRDPPGMGNYGGGYGYRPDRRWVGRANDKTIMTAICTRIATDAASITINHVRLDENDRYSETLDSGLNSCLNLSGNLDQTGRALRYDLFLSMLTEGVVALVPVDVDVQTGEESICSMRVGRVVEWYPAHVRLEVYNEKTGQKEEITLPKERVALIENPFYAVMNEPNGTIQRLMRKLALMDVIDEQVGSGKLDMIIQLPYVVRNDVQKQRADDRRAEIERQLTGSKYGIAYIDGTEHITQLNRSLENNLLKTVEYLTDMAYSQLGITPEIMNGTATDAVMTNYENRTIEPLVAAVVDEMKRKFLTEEQRKEGRESVVYFRDPFKLTPISTVAEMADKFTRNEIMTSNEFRQAIGMKPSKDPKADELRNANISQSNEEIAAQNKTIAAGKEAVERSIKNQNGEV